MNVVMAVAGCCVIVAGLFQIFARDMAWKSTEWNNKLRGIRSEETSTWRVASVLQGVAAIVGGLFLLLLATQMNNRSPQQPEAIQTPIIESPKH